MQIQVTDTLDVEAVERELAKLWEQTAEANADSDEALLRARVADLIIFHSGEENLAGVRAVLQELSAMHPCRALVLAAERNAPDRDIEMHISAFCAEDKRSKRNQISCEEITLTARGIFVSELPSVTVPLLVPDIPVFLWWRDSLRPEAEVFTHLYGTADRLIVDSAELENPAKDLSLLAELFSDRGARGISDINWARLTSWRALLANFYDVANYLKELDHIKQVRIDYVAPNAKPEMIAPQGVLIAGWLASRLEWSLADDHPPATAAETAFHFEERGRRLEVVFQSIEHSEMRPGRLARVELITEGDRAASFSVSRSSDGLYLETHATMGSDIHPGTALPVRNRTTADLLAREMEILAHDRIYEEALKVAVRMLL